MKVKGSNISIIQSIHSLIRSLNISDIVISPGSRNIPLINSFANDDSISCHSVIDEREAAYIALGMAKKPKPIALVSTSGTASLNYSSAVAEAFYQNIRLLILTADRPLEMINKGENQTLIQKNIYSDFIQKNISISEPINYEVASEVHQSLCKGPVHINVHINEPLNEITEYKLDEFTFKKVNSDYSWNLDFNKIKKIIIYISESQLTDKEQSILDILNNKYKCIVISEVLANYKSNTHCSFDIALEMIEDPYNPNVLVTMGSSIISKKAKNYFKSIENLVHIDVAPYNRTWNTICSDFHFVMSDYEIFLKYLEVNLNINQQFSVKYNQYFIKANKLHENFLKQNPNSELSVVSHLMNDAKIGSNSIIYWGNSSIIRYANLCKSRNDILHHGNRGVSGIDGVLSSSVGLAHKNPDKGVFCVLGDVSMIYEANTLKNLNMAPNLKIIIFNNKGGMIFNNIHSGLDKNSKSFIETPLKYNFNTLSQLFDIDYFICDIEKNDSLWTVIDNFINNDGNAIIEIVFDENSATLLNDYYNYCNM